MTKDAQWLYDNGYYPLTHSNMCEKLQIPLKQQMAFQTIVEVFKKTSEDNGYRRGVYENQNEIKKALGIKEDE